MRHLLLLLSAVALGSSLLSGCQSMGGEEPAPDCATPATIRHPSCFVLNCPEHPLLLVLDDGQELRPFGADWEAFRTSATANAGNLPERVLISYKPEATPHIYTWHNATITCVSAAQ